MAVLQRAAERRAGTPQKPTSENTQTQLRVCLTNTSPSFVSDAQKQPSGLMIDHVVMGRKEGLSIKQTLTLVPEGPSAGPVTLTRYLHHSQPHFSRCSLEETKTPHRLVRR